jgi:phage shock protein PspC (stress-responsive transcriptional regulator)
MNKTIAINLGGTVFNIEEDAFQLLKHYLDTIQSYFAGDPSASEIMSDIEVRVAELFHEKNNDGKNVVTRQDVEDMMKVMGKPEDYRVDNDEAPREESTVRNSKRKIYRDTDDAVIAGVCSGLSHYLGWDPIVVRVAVVILFFASFGGPMFLGYILFWALVPAAKSTAEKLQMRGENVNVENIGRFVNQETKAAAERVQKFGRQTAESIRTGSTPVLQGLGRVFAIIFGIFFLMMGFGLIIGLIALLSFSEFSVFGLDGNNWEVLDKMIFNYDGTLWIFVIGVILSMATPAIGLIYGAIKLITGSTKRIKGMAVTLTSLFIIGVIMCSYGGIRTGKNFSRNAELSNSTLMNKLSTDTLYFDVMPDSMFIGRTGRHNEFFDLIKQNGEFTYLGQPLNVHFEPTTSSQVKVTVTRASKGSHMEEAGNLARNIAYDYRVGGDTVMLAPYFTIPIKDLYRAQEVEVKVYVPVGKYVKFGTNSHLISWYSEEDGVLMMTDDGLEEVEENDDDSTTKLEINGDTIIIQHKEGVEQ